MEGRQVWWRQEKVGIRVAKRTEKEFKIIKNVSETFHVCFIILGHTYFLILKIDLQSFIIKSTHINDLCDIFGKMVLLTVDVVVFVSSLPLKEIDT